MRVHFWQEDRGDSVGLAGLSGGIDVSFGPEIGGDTEVLVKGFVSLDDVAGLEHLRACVVPWAGLPDRTRETFLVRSEVCVYNLHHNAASTAETALALLFACARRIVPHDRMMREGDWAPRWSGDDSVQLAGHEMVVLGYGAIGKRICQAGLALGMGVSAVRLTEPRGLVDRVWVYPPEALAEVLDGARVLVCCLPLTDRSREMVGAAELGQMDRLGVVVNVSRGPVIDEGALFSACQAGRLHGAGLDVWWKYPGSEDESRMCRPGEFAWHELDNVVMSPHVGGAHKENEAERLLALVELLNGLSVGEVAGNRVDVERGY